MDRQHFPETYLRKWAPADRAKYIKTHPDRPHAILKAVAAGTWAVGMTEEEVRLAIVRPDDINRTVTGDAIHEQWVWDNGGKTYYLYLTNGILTSWQETDRLPTVWQRRIY